MKTIRAMIKMKRRARMERRKGFEEMRSLIASEVQVWDWKESLEIQLLKGKE